MKLDTSIFGLHEDTGFQMAPMIDVVFLLIGPAWLLHFIYKKAGIGY